jgi:hypothetical protein
MRRDLHEGYARRTGDYAMKLQVDELDGWVLERADFERLPAHGYLFYSDRRCYVCYPASGARRMRDVLPRVVDLLARAGGRVVLSATLADRWGGPGYGPSIRSVDGRLLEYARTTQAAVEAGASEAARRRGGRFALRIDSGGEYATQFRAAYGCSGVALLRSLDALDSHLLAYLATPLGSHERSLLRASGAHLVGAPPAQGGKVAALAWSAANAGFDAWLDARRRERRAASAAWRARDATAELVNRLTWKGARALGLTNTGRVATGQRADRPRSTPRRFSIWSRTRGRPRTDGPFAVDEHGGPSAGDFAIRFAH